jgi:small subunit ribosomal protein S9
MAQTAYYATGKRKTAIARTWLIPGEGSHTVNGRPMEQYFTQTLCLNLSQPFKITNTLGLYHLRATVHGGGIAGQAGALKHGISKALLEAHPDLRTVLKKAGFLTRDSRIKERKKYGLKGARARYQYSKR